MRPELGPDPSEARNFTDPGDATGRNFRYQHAYGVMLLGATVALLWRSAPTSAIAWGLTMAIKQYLATSLVLAPLLPIWPGMTRRRPLSLWK